MIRPLLVALLFLSACTSEKEYAELDWVDETMPYQQQNVQVPRKLWVAIKDVLTDQGIKEDILNSFAITPAVINVDITTDYMSVLKGDKNHRLTFVEGGGELDLMNYVDGKGKFNMRFEPHGDSDYPLHLLYISESRGKVVGGDQQWGNGCGKIYNLTEVIDRFTADKGMLLVNNKKTPYMHLMAGFFVFFQMIEDRLHLGYVHVKDARYMGFTCEPLT